MSHIDIQQEITNSFITLIESGVKPWVCPWNQSNPFPTNWLTKDLYNGINVLILWLRAMEENYTFNYWLTFKQAQQLGGRVKKGQKGVRCVFYRLVEKEANTNDDEKTSYPVISYFSLFNIDQIEGLPDTEHLTVEQSFDDDNASLSIKRYANIYCQSTGLTIANGGSKAFYAPSKDAIQLPNSFNSPEGYVATLAHEIGHSTGHKSRLDRFSENDKRFKSSKERYAFEELCAELFAAFLCAELGVKGEHENHASYLSHWLEILKNDKTFLFKASSAASKAYQYFNGIVVTDAEQAA